MKYVTKRAEASDAKASSPNDELHQLVENLALQPRLEQFAEATGLSVLLRSWPDGPRVLEVGGAASPLLQDDDETLDLTVGSGAPDEVGERGHALRRCRHQLLHGHAKIVFEGGPIGTLSLGGVLTESPDLALAADRAKALGIDEGAYLAAIAATPIFTEDRLRACLLFASEVVTDLAAKRAENLRTKREAERLGRTLSELRKVQERLSESQGQLRTLVDTLPELIWLKDLDGVYLACNRRFESFFGATAREIVGKTDYDFVDRELADFFRENDRAAMRAGGPRTNEEEIAFASDGHRELLETVKTPMKDSSGRVIGVLGIGRDITERRRSETEREALRAQLFDARHMEAVGRLAGGVAHDFNNLLSPIIGYTELLMEDMDAESVGSSELEHIHFAANRCRSLVQQLLAFGRRQPLSVRRADINEVVRAFAPLIRGSVPETVLITYVMAEDLPPVLVDPPVVEQALMNLVLNGADAMAEGGQLTIRTKALRVQDRNLWDVELGDYVELAVSDTGSGIPPDVIEHIFEPFFSTKDDRGRGLGLAMVYGVVRQHGGDVRVVNEAHEGAVFRLLLPAAPLGDALSERPGPVDTLALEGNERILLVEDQVGVRTLGRRILTRKGYDVTVASNGLEALELLEADGDLFDLILTDVVMPELSGPQLVERVQERWPRLKVLFMTGYADDLVKQQRAFEKRYKVVHKPFSQKELLTSVRQVLNERETS